jgi:hypothetical protein
MKKLKHPEFLKVFCLRVSLLNTLSSGLSWKITCCSESGYSFSSEIHLDYINELLMGIESSEGVGGLLCVSVWHSLISTKD